MAYFVLAGCLLKGSLSEEAIEGCSCNQPLDTDTKDSGSILVCLVTAFIGETMKGGEDYFPGGSRERERD